MDIISPGRSRLWRRKKGRKYKQVFKYLGYKLPSPLLNNQENKGGKGVCVWGCILIQFYLSFQFVQLNLYGQTISILSVTNPKWTLDCYLVICLRWDPPPHPPRVTPRSSRATAWGSEWSSSRWEVEQSKAAFSFFNLEAPAPIWKRP